MSFRAKYNELVSLVTTALEAHHKLPLFAEERDSTWTHRSYDAIGDLAMTFERILRARNIAEEDVVAIVSANCPEWLAIAIAAHRLGAAVVPMYEVQQEKEWRYILRDSGAKICFVSNNTLQATIAAMKPELPALAHVQTFEARSDHDADATFVLKKHREPPPNELAFLIYTSGTTGNPKGVELSHSALAFVVCSLHEAIPFPPGGRTVSVLPWAYVGGLVELFTSLHSGTTIALTASPDHIVPAIHATHPTRLSGDPHLWNRLHDGIQQAMATSSGLIRGLFQRGIKASAARRAGQPVSFTDRIALMIAEQIVFPKARAQLGGELSLAMCGGAAALSIDVARIIDALGIELLEVYGVTEVGALATVNRPDESRLGTVGRVLPGVEIRIDGVGELGGEILIKSPGMMTGYRGLPEETRAVITTDGWVRSGDLGSLDADGYLTITKRLREI